jgi:signal transduction histidine kinase
MISPLLRGTPGAVLVRAGAMIALIAITDWRVEREIPLGFLYLFPMLLVGSTLPRWAIAIVAIICTALTEAFDSFPWQPISAIPRDILYFAAFFCMGLFVFEVGRSRRLAQDHLNRIEVEIQRRREAEEQLKILVDSSPAAIFTLDPGGIVLLANDAAHRLFLLPPGSLSGTPIGHHLPALATVPACSSHGQAFRTVMQSRGRRSDGDVFLADIWFSTYWTSAGPRLAAMVIDTSEDLRSREESSLHQLLAGSRILVGAVSHEIRNICGAIAVVHQNLARDSSIAQSKDFEALGTLIVALEKVSAMELRHTANQASAVDLESLLEELNIIIEPDLRDRMVEVSWNIASDLPHVWADRHSLMQVFLNLTKNSVRAMSGQTRRSLTISACSEKDRVLVEVRDTGGGVNNPDSLFRPFQPGAQATGLGLYLSRAFMRSFRGDLRYKAVSGGAAFLVDLSPAFSLTDNLTQDDEQYSPPADRRPRSLPRESEPAPSSRT